MTIWKRLVWLAIFLLCAPAALHAHENADITGIVTDSTGAGVPHVTITLT